MITNGKKKVSAKSAARSRLSIHALNKQTNNKLWYSLKPPVNAEFVIIFKGQ